MRPVRLQGVPHHESSGVPELLRRLSDAGVELRDLETRQSTLEDIFVSLVHDSSRPVP